MLDIVSGLAHGVFAGILYSSAGYLRNRGQARLALRSGEKLSDEAVEQLAELAAFDPAQFVATVIQGAAIGLFSWLLTQAGLPLTLEGAENILLQTGLLTLIRKVYGFVSAMLVWA